MAQHNCLGKKGEEEAANYLIRNGYVVRDVNWRSGKFELDIVATQGTTLVVVEVKTRSSSLYEHPEEAVTGQKIQNIINATHAYLMQLDIALEVRFDIIAIVKQNGGFEVEHIEDAFYPPLCR